MDLMHGMDDVTGVRLLLGYQSKFLDLLMNAIQKLLYIHTILCYLHGVSIRTLETVSKSEAREL